jgi:hypothetical protein
MLYLGCNLTLIFYRKVLNESYAFVGLSFTPIQQVCVCHVLITNFLL